MNYYPGDTRDRRRREHRCMLCGQEFAIPPHSLGLLCRQRATRNQRLRRQRQIVEARKIYAALQAKALQAKRIVIVAGIEYFVMNS